MRQRKTGCACPVSGAITLKFALQPMILPDTAPDDDGMPDLVVAARQVDRRRARIDGLTGWPRWRPGHAVRRARRNAAARPTPPWLVPGRPRASLGPSRASGGPGVPKRLAAGLLRNTGGCSARSGHALDPDPVGEGELVARGLNVLRRERRVGNDGGLRRRPYRPPSDAPRPARRSRPPRRTRARR